jgi:hypothetical protein
MHPDRLAASARTHKSLIMFFLRARIVDGGRILIRNEVCPNVTGRAQTRVHDFLLGDRVAQRPHDRTRGSCSAGRASPLTNSGSGRRDALRAGPGGRICRPRETLVPDHVRGEGCIPRGCRHGDDASRLVAHGPGVSNSITIFFFDPCYRPATGLCAGSADSVCGWRRRRASPVPLDSRSLPAYH